MRNTMLLIGFLAVLAILIAWVNLTRPQQALPHIAPTEAPTPTPAERVYTDAYCRIEFRYPSSYERIDLTSGSSTVVDPQNPENPIVIACQKEIPRPPLRADLIETLNLASVSANLYHDASSQDGTPQDKLIFTHPLTGMDVFIAGHGVTYESIISSLTLK